MVRIEVGGLAERVGQEVAVSDWIEIPQERIDRFADATGDRQWIHVDAARAAAESPFPTTIAQGFLTLSLVSTMLRESVAFTDLGMAINCGVNRARFTAAVLAGSRIRGRFTLAHASEVEGGMQALWHVTVECEQARTPCLTVDWMIRYYRSGASRVAS